MGKFSLLLLDGIVASTAATASAQENVALRANQNENTQAVVYTNNESYSYSKYTNSFINLYISAADAKRFLNTLKDGDKDSSLQLIGSWHRLLIAEKKPDVWADRQLEGIEAITQYFYDSLDSDPSNSKEWFRTSASKKGLLIRLEVRITASWGAFGVNYAEEVHHFVNGIDINSSFTTDKIYEVLVS